MLGSILGDIIGSTYEWHNVKTEDFELFPKGSHFTDDSVMTVAEIQSTIEKRFGYNLSFTLDSIRQGYHFDSRSSFSVPPAIVAFLESENYESAVRKAISIGGDSDTIACIAGGIAHAFYQDIPNSIVEKGWMLLDSGLKNTMKQFCCAYKVEY